MTLFDSEEAAPTLFDSQTADTAQPQPNLNLPDTTVARTAHMAAIALTPPDEYQKNQQALLSKYYDDIKVAGDEGVRSQAAANQQVQQLTGLTKLIQDHTTAPEDYQGAVVAARNVINQGIEERKQYALERAAIDNIQTYAASGDTTTATMLYHNYVNGDAAHVIGDANAKYLILQREIEKAGVATEDQGWFKSLVSHVIGSSSILGMGNSIGEINNVDLPSVTKHWYDTLVSGNRINSEKQSLWNLDIKDFAAYAPKLVQNLNHNNDIGVFMGSDKAAVARNLAQYQTGHTIGFTHDAVQLLDNFGIIGPAEIKNMVSIPGMLLRNGGRKVAGDAVALAMTSSAAEGSEKASVRAGMSAEDMQRAASPDAVNDIGKVSTVSPQRAANEAYARGKSVIDAMSPNLQSAGRLDSAELAKAVDRTQKRLEGDYGRALMNVEVQETALTGGKTVKNVVAIVGKPDGTGYLTASAAKQGAVSMGLPVDPTTIIRDESGQWFVKVASPVDETGMFATKINPAKSGVISRFVKGAREIGDEGLANAAQVSGNTSARLQGALQQNYGKLFNSLNHNERTALDSVIQYGEQEGKWLSEQEFSTAYQRTYKRQPTDKEITAYRAHQEINDAEYALRNDEVYKELQTSGHQAASFDPGIGKPVVKGNAKINLKPDSVPSERVYNVTDGVHYTVANPLSPERLKQLADNGHALVTLKTPLELADGTEVTTFLVKKNQLTVDLLEQTQLNYRPGGHRVYEGKYFGKQAISGVQADTGKAFLKNPNTYIVGKTMAEVKFWANRMEQARQLYLDGKGVADIEAVFGGHAGFESGQSFIDNMTKGVYSKNHAFEALGDRELPTVYHNTDLDSRFVDRDITGTNGYLQTHGRMYESRKGETLKDWQGAQAPVLDSFKTINQALSNIASMTSFSDYKDQVINRWASNFRQYLDEKTFDVAGSDISAMMNGKFKTGNAELRAVANAGENQRSVAKRILHWKSDLDREFEQKQRDFEQFIVGDNPEGVQAKVGTQVVDWWKDNNPVRGARAMAFDLKLGLFNVAQFPLQIGTLVSATTINPEFGFKGMVNLMPLRHYLTNAGTEDMLNMYAQRGLHKLQGMEVDEWKNMMRQAKTSGFFDIGNSHALVNSGGPNAAMSQIGSTANAVRETGRFFFNEGEVWNRAVAWRIAWNEAKQTGLDVTSQEFKNKLAGSAEKYAWSMSSTSQAAWQSGALSIPTQFWAYNARMMEMMFGKQLTGVQKTRLILGQTLLFGSAGFPVLPAMSDWIKQKSADPNLPPDTPIIGDQKAFDINSFYGMFDRGLLDEVIYHMTGADAKVGSRIATGNMITDTIQQLLGHTKYGTTSAADFLGGATGSTLMQGSKTLMDLLKYTGADRGMVTDQALTRDNVLKVMSNVSSLGNGLKGYMALKYGTLQSNSGTTLVQDPNMPGSQAVLASLGFQPGAMDKTGAILEYQKHKSEAIKDAVKELGKLDTNFLNRADQREDITNQRALFVRLIPDDIRAEVLKKSRMGASHSLSEGIAQQYTKERGQAAMRRTLTDGESN